MRILIADDHALFRRGLKSLIVEAWPGAACHEAENAQKALDHSLALELDIVILDISMPGRSGLDVLKEITKARPKTPVLVLSMYPEEQYAVRALKAGAAGYITKLKAPQQLVAAIRKVLKGGHYVSTALAEKMACDLGKGQTGPPHESLTDREYQVFRLVAGGRTVSQIASEIYISVQTVSTHRAHIMEKMGLHTNAELMKYAMQNNLAD